MTGPHASSGTDNLAREQPVVSKFLGALSRLSILRFALIGALGMPVDWVALHAMIDAGASRDAARVISWFCAATFTWLGNRYFTFAAQRAHGKAIFQEWLRFLGANSIGGVANVGTFFLLTHFARAPFSGTNIAFVCGVLVGLIFNFTLSKKLVFRSVGARRSDR
jgi:putative flippase GtrA